MAGKFSEFDVKSGNWTLYCDRLDMYFLANGVEDKLKVPTLIANVGESAYELIVNLCSPDKPSTLSYTKIVSLVKDHLEPVPSALAERYKFRQCRQQNGQSIADYVATLKQMSRFCDFGSELQENLRDQLVCGITSDAIRQRLFSDKKLEYSKAVLIATTMESAEKDSSIMIESPAIGMHYYAGHNGKKRCTACGDMSHERLECKFKDYACDICSRVGHLRRVCPDGDGQGFRARSEATRNWGIGSSRGYGGGSRGRGSTGRGGGAGKRRRGARGGAAFARQHCIMEDPEPDGAAWRGDGGAGTSTEPGWHPGPAPGERREDDSDDELPMYQMGLSQYRPITTTPSLFTINEVKYTDEVADVDIVAQFPWGQEVVEIVTMNNKDTDIKNALRINCSTSLEGALFILLLDGQNGVSKTHLRLHRKMTPYKMSFALNYEDLDNKETLNELAILLYNLLESEKISTWLPDFALSMESQIKENLLMGVAYTAVISEGTLSNGIMHLLNSNTTLKEQIHIADLSNYAALLFKK